MAVHDWNDRLAETRVKESTRKAILVTLPDHLCLAIRQFTHVHQILETQSSLSISWSSVSWEGETFTFTHMPISGSVSIEMTSSLACTSG